MSIDREVELLDLSSGRIISKEGIRRQGEERAFYALGYIVRTGRILQVRTGIYNIDTAIRNKTGAQSEAILYRIQDDRGKSILKDELLHHLLNFSEVEDLARKIIRSINQGSYYQKAVEEYLKK